MKRANKVFNRLAIVLIISFSAACSTVPKQTNNADPLVNNPTVVSYDNYQDPLIGYNRLAFSFNDKVYRYGLFPLIDGYDWLIPDIAQTHISNFFYNLKSPIYLVNNLLQGKLGKASKNIARFTINTTIGIAGIFDPANDWFHIEKAATGFEDTLTTYGMGYGAYLVLPILGPSDLRHGPGLLVDHTLNPLTYHENSELRMLLIGVDYANENTSKGDMYKKLYEKTHDPYLFFRNLYLQNKLRDEPYNEQK